MKRYFFVGIVLLVLSAFGYILFKRGAAVPYALRVGSTSISVPLATNINDIKSSVQSKMLPTQQIVDVDGNKLKMGVVSSSDARHLGASDTENSTVVVGTFAEDGVHSDEKGSYISVVTEIKGNKLTLQIYTKSSDRGNVLVYLPNSRKIEKSQLWNIKSIEEISNLIKKDGDTVVYLDMPKDQFDTEQGSSLPDAVDKMKIGLVQKMIL